MALPRWMAMDTAPTSCDHFYSHLSLSRAGSTWVSRSCTKDQKDNILCAKMNASRDSHLIK